MPPLPRSEPRRKGSPRWFLVFWLVVVAIRMWSLNRWISIGILAIALLILLTGLRPAERPYASPSPTAGPMARPSPNVETITMPSTPPDARPIEPDVGGATGKLIFLAIVLLGLGALAFALWKRLP